MIKSNKIRYFFSRKISSNIVPEGPELCICVSWSYTIKVDRKLCVIICLLRHKNERTFMSGF
ncbi:hypothetical protein EFO27_04055, partial [Lactococcus cremoris]|nr:hypothetical protein [Lactococcus cremoris]